MTEFQEKLDEFKELKTFDPKIKIKNELVIIQPYYFSYSFLMNFVGIFVSAYGLTFQNETTINLIFFLLVGVMVFFIISELRTYNTVHIDIKQRKITVYPNIFLSPFKKKKVIDFDEVQKISAKSNYYSGGFWMAYRRYYIILVLKNEDEFKLIGSNKDTTAIRISEKIDSIFKYE